MPAPDPAEARRAMVEGQLRGRDIADENVLEAMAQVPRELFVPEPEWVRAYADAALPIGHGQTISQPYMVARIAEALALRPGELVLDVGTGSGYQAAVVAELGARVVTIERIPELAERARESLAAAAPGFPQTLYDQLRPRGRLVVPVGGQRAQRLEVIVRSPEGPAVVHSVPCRFVPLVGEEGFGP
jgi:protein-L-isoaspartate(D-aspartate) O-methyltransferase